MITFFNDFFNETIEYFISISKYIKFVFVIILFFISPIFQFIPIYLFNIDMNNVSDLTTIYLSLFSNLVFLIIIVLIYHKKLKEQFLKLKNMKKNKLINILDTSFRYWLIGLVIMIGTNLIINKMGINIPNNDAFIRKTLKIAPIISSISVIFISPLIEEIVFRLSFREIIKNKWLFILVSGFIFGSIHVITSITKTYELLYLIPYCSLGVAFSFIYEYSDNVYISYLLHLTHNTLTALTVFLLAGVII